MKNLFLPFALLAALAFAGCSSPSAGSACATSDDCPDKQECLTEFKGGYCGFKGCTKDADCPESTICVKQGGANYCFLTCTDKAGCNEERGADNEANCSSNIEYVAGKGSNDAKACVPPSAS